MPTFDFIRYPNGGPPEFVRSKSFTHRGHRHGHHHHHHTCKCFDDCAGVSRTEYENLLVQNRALCDTNASLTAERDSLKVDLDRLHQTRVEEYRRLVAQIEALRDQNDRLRRSVSVDDDQKEAFVRRIKVMEKELRKERKDNEVLANRFAQESELAASLRRKLDLIKRNFDTIRDTLAIRERQLKNRDAIINEKNATIRQLRDLLERYRGW
ncbi:hypothetical protein BX600DRAFT_147819 [Xylariales sp. PMI_506]|nr:hypothetical protein BX600DRAFT_147819 [Xylariales sp. PMI_506]